MAKLLGCKDFLMKQDILYASKITLKIYKAKTQALFPKRTCANL